MANSNASLVTNSCACASVAFSTGIISLEGRLLCVVGNMYAVYFYLRENCLTFHREEMDDKNFRMTLKIHAFSNVTPFVWASSSRCLSKDRIAFVFRIKRPLLRELDPEDEGSTIRRNLVKHSPDD